MGGKSKAQTTGYKYYMGLLMGWCHGPVDAILEIRGGDRTAWTGSQEASGAISIDAPKLFGGDEREGGIVGTLDVCMGESTQGVNSYLTAKIGAGRPAYRGLLTTVFRGGQITSNNPYIKPWAMRVRRILQGWKGGSAWYSAKAQIGGLVTGSIPQYIGAVPFSGPGVDRIGSNVRQLKLLSESTTHFNMERKTYTLGGSLVSTETFSIPKLDGDDDCELRLFQNSAKYTQQRRPGAGSSNVSAWFEDDVQLARPIGATVLESGTYYSAWAQSTGNNNPPIFANDAIYSTGGLAVTYLAKWPLSDPDTPSAYYSFTDVAAYHCVDENGYIWLSIPGESRTVKLDQNLNEIASYTGAVPVGGAGFAVYNEYLFGSNGAYPYWMRAHQIIGGTVTEVGVSTTISGALPVISIGDGYFTCDGFLFRIELTPTVGSMNPAHIVYECLTNDQWGMGYDSSIIDNSSFTAAADTFHAEGLGLCIQWLRQDSIESFIQLVMDHAGAVLAEDRQTGLILLKPIRGGYSLGSLPEFGSELGNVLEMRRFERASVTDTINEVSVTYTDVETGKTGSIAVQNLAAIQASGRVISQSRDYPGLPTIDLALRTALRDLRGYTSGLARVQLTLNREAYALTPGDVIKFSWLPDGITQMPLRVINVDYGSLTDGKVQVECLEDVFGLPATTYMAQQTTGWVAPITTAEASPAVAVFEAPYRELLGAIGRAETQALTDEAGYLASVAARAPGFNLNYQLYLRTGADPYADAGAADWCPTGTITADLSVTGTSITLTADDGLDLIDAGSTAMLGTGVTAEIVRVVAVDIGTKTLTIARGCLDTVPAAWASGTRFFAYDQYSAAGNVEYALAETVDAKILTSTTSDLLDIGTAPGGSVTMAQRQARPYPPGLLKFSDASASNQVYPATLVGSVTTSWAHRDRILQDDQIIDTLEASIGPEPGVTYTVRYYQPPATLVNTQSAISGTSASGYTFPADGPAKITVEAVRGGLGSWQLINHSFDYYIAPLNTRTIVGADRRVTVGGDVRKTRG